MRINSIGRTGPYCYSTNICDERKSQINKTKVVNCPNFSFNGKLSGTPITGSTTREILEIIGVSTIPVLLMIFLSNLLKKNNKHSEHIFLNDGTYLAHTDEFFHE